MQHHASSAELDTRGHLLAMRLQRRGSPSRTLIWGGMTRRGLDPDQRGPLWVSTGLEAEPPAIPLWVNRGLMHRSGATDKDAFTQRLLRRTAALTYVSFLSLPPITALLVAAQIRSRGKAQS